MANGTAKQQVLDKYWSDDDGTASDTWDMLNLDSVFFGLDHMMLSYALETSVEEATANFQRILSSHDSADEYWAENTMQCYKDYRNLAAMENEGNDELIIKLDRFVDEAYGLTGIPRL